MKMTDLELLVEENNRYRKALEHYADEHQWVCMGNMDLPHHASDACHYDTWYGDGRNGFNVAQEALADNPSDDSPKDSTPQEERDPDILKIGEHRDDSR